MDSEQTARFFELHDSAKAIINSDVPWDEKYYTIFSDEISGSIASCGIMVTWYDPNMTYEENVMAYWDLIDDEYHKIQAAMQTEQGV